MAGNQLNQRIWDGVNTRLNVKWSLSENNYVVKCTLIHTEDWVLRYINRIPVLLYEYKTKKLNKFTICILRDYKVGLYLIAALAAIVVRCKEMKLAITVGLWHCVALDLVVSNPINVIKCLTWVASEWNMRACLVWISKFSLWRYLVFNYVHLNCNIIYILYVHPRVPGYMQWWIFVCESCLCISCGMADIQWCQGCVWLNKSVRSRVWRAMDSPRDWAVTYIKTDVYHYIYMYITYTWMLHAYMHDAHVHAHTCMHARMHAHIHSHAHMHAHW